MVISVSALRCGTNARTLSHPSGIGLESDLLFASEGAHVVAADLNLEAAQKAVKLIDDRYKIKAIAVKVDVSKEDQIKALVDEAVKTFGRLDIMVRLIASPAFLY